MCHFSGLSQEETPLSGELTSAKEFTTEKGFTTKEMFKGVLGGDKRNFSMG
jgi:hypothetical protein